MIKFKVAGTSDMGVRHPLALSGSGPAWRLGLDHTPHEHISLRASAPLTSGMCCTFSLRRREATAVCARKCQLAGCVLRVVVATTPAYILHTVPHEYLDIECCLARYGW